MRKANLRMKKKTFSFVLITAAVIFAVGSIILGSREHVQQGYGVVLSYGINIAVFFILLMASIKRYTYSFDMMIWLFSLFFFGFAPLLQFFTGIYSWELKPTQTEIIRTNVFILLFSICICCGKGIRVKVKRKKQAKCNYYIKKDRLRIYLVISFLIMLYYLYSVGFKNMLISATNVNDNLNSMMGMLVSHGFKNISLFTAVLYVMKCKGTKRVDVEAVLALLIFFISCFPTGLSRNMMGSFYGGLLLLFFDKKRDKRWLTYAIIFGLILVFPAANVFRNAATMSGESFSELVLSNIQNTYLEAHYDAHQMCISAQQYVSKFGFSYGYQLLGVLLFFVPRSVWPTKPYGTGQMIFEALQQHWFTNVSMPLVAEAFVNFGIAGIVVFGLVVGCIVNRVDEKFWEERRAFSFTKVLYPFIMLKFFFMLRGDLLSSWAYMFAQLVVGYAMLRFATKRKPSC